MRLYEEAASLYMHTGDNMLAIYASEKALRLAERLEESAAASRAHGIFGRVFGRIGDSERARENLEQSVELARKADPAEAIRALLALGYHFEISEADYAAAAEAYGEALEIAERIGDLPSQVELHASLSTLALHRGEWEAVESGTETVAALVEREGLTGKLCFPHLLRGALRWRSGDLEGAERSLRRSAELAEQVGRSEIGFQALHWLATALRDRGEYANADQALATALDTCERAGLVSQSVEATAARAINQALWGRADQAVGPRRGGDRPGRAAALPGRRRCGARSARRRDRRRGRPRRGTRGLAEARPPGGRRARRHPDRADQRLAIRRRAPVMLHGIMPSRMREDSINPFRFGALALDEAFADRDVEVRELVRDVRNGQDVVIFAPRRFGKSSLAWRAAQELVRKRVLVAQLDLMNTPTKARLAERLADSIYENVASPLERARERALAPFRGLQIQPTVTHRPRGRKSQLQLRPRSPGAGPRRDARAAPRPSRRARRGQEPPRRAGAGRVPGDRRHRPEAADAVAVRLPTPARGGPRLPRVTPARDGAHLQRRERAVLA